VRIWEAIVSEINHAELDDRRVRALRVTTDAVAGSLAAMPITPERARTVGRLWMLEDSTVVAEDLLYDLELLVHPSDWYALLAERGPSGQFVVQPHATVANVEHILGIPVTN
jgi:hypothetical protein